MDFIEQWFHVSPDAGSGVLEAIYGATVLAVTAVALFGRRIAARANRRRGAAPPRR